ncbi:hypothetical protein EG329_002434 [Mollisiaceae sp. DMI_Dod_QoI]|nr:hypothetical protein EG329_002434 [Helotiales sp. DMI_Dod_QoI]
MQSRIQILSYASSTNAINVSALHCYWSEICKVEYDHSYTDLPRLPDDDDIVLVTPIDDRCRVCIEHNYPQHPTDLSDIVKASVIPIEYEGLSRKSFAEMATSRPSVRASVLPPDMTAEEFKKSQRASTAKLPDYQSKELEAAKGKSNVYNPGASRNPASARVLTQAPSQAISKALSQQHLPSRKYGQPQQPSTPQATSKKPPQNESSSSSLSSRQISKAASLRSETSSQRETSSSPTREAEKKPLTASAALRRGPPKNVNKSAFYSTYGGETARDALDAGDGQVISEHDTSALTFLARSSSRARQLSTSGKLERETSSAAARSSRAETSLADASPTELLSSKSNVLIKAASHIPPSKVEGGGTKSANSRRQSQRAHESSSQHISQTRESPRSEESGHESIPHTTTHPHQSTRAHGGVARTAERHSVFPGSEGTMQSRTQTQSGSYSQSTDSQAAEPEPARTASSNHSTTHARQPRTRLSKIATQISTALRLSSSSSPSSPTHTEPQPIEANNIDYRGL